MKIERTKFVVLCCVCRKMKTKEGKWIEFNEWFKEDTLYSHGICKPCAEKLYPELSIFNTEQSDKE